MRTQAPECALMVLQLRRMFRGLRRGSVLEFVLPKPWIVLDSALQEAQGRAPLQKFMTALEACALC